jgi:formate-dependent nitrite reductase membrane component NrfD
VSYDTPHQAPWGWRVSLYTWTKSIAAGAYVMAVLLAAGGVLHGTSALWRWGAPALALAFLGITGALLIADLKHPERFYLIFTRPQWKSWLVRGAFLIAAYGVLLVLALVAASAGAGSAQRAIAVPGFIAGLLTAVYTAALFAQARARDLWASPWLAPHLSLQALLAGAAALIPCAGWLEPSLVRPLLLVLAGTAALHLVFVAAETLLPRETAHARLAVHEMTGGRAGREFWGGAVLTAAALVAAAVLGGRGELPPPVAGALTAVLALAGLFAYEHAYVQAGQAVPLA